MSLPDLPDTTRPIFRAHVVPDRASAERAVANEICELVARKPHAVLGLATGGTMVGVYAELVRRHQAGGLDLSRVTTFNLDEYVGVDLRAPQSFHSYITEHLLRHVNVAPGRAYLMDPEAFRADMDAACARWEEAIKEAGGLDLQLLGLGRNGHIAFNEPGASLSTRTRQVNLDIVTREDAAASFGGFAHTPRAAVTMGVATILAARRLRVLAFGAHKSPILRRVLGEPIGSDVPGTFLRGHDDLEFWLDAAAANGLGDLLPPE